MTKGSGPNSRGKLPAVEVEGMQVAISRGLREDTPKGEVGCICLHCEGQVWLVVPEDGGRGEGLLEGAEGCCCLV